MAGVAQVYEQRGGGIVEDVEPGLFRDVPKLTFAVVLVQPVGQTAGLADVEFVPAVVVDVGGGDPVLAVDVDAAGRIQAGPPVRHATRELVVKRAVAREGVPGHVAKPGPVGVSERLGNRPAGFAPADPVLQAPLIDTANVVAHDVAGQGIEPCRAHLAECGLPALAAAEHRLRDTGRDIPILDARARPGQIPAPQFGAEARLELHCHLLAGKLVEAGFSKRHHGGVPRLLAKFDRERSRGVRKTGCSEGCEKLAAVHKDRIPRRDPLQRERVSPALRVRIGIEARVGCDAPFPRRSK